MTESETSGAFLGGSGGGFWIAGVALISTSPSAFAAGLSEETSRDFDELAKGVV